MYISKNEFKRKWELHLQLLSLFFSQARARYALDNLSFINEQNNRGGALFKPGGRLCPSHYCQPPGFKIISTPLKYILPKKSLTKLSYLC